MQTPTLRETHSLAVFLFSVYSRKLVISQLATLDVTPRLARTALENIRAWMIHKLTCDFLTHLL